MLTSERYLLLLEHCHAAEAPSDEIEITIGDLGRLFHCTERNVKLIVRKLEEEELIHWIPGRGRGNRSRITLRMSRDEFIIQQAKQLVHKGEYREAFEFIHSYAENTFVKETFIEWVNGHFGYDKQASAAEGKDLLRLPVYRTLLSLDPAKLYFDFDAHMVRQLFDRLVQYDNEQRRIVPMLAHSWDSNSEGTRWTFYLRKGVRFHHGRELNADDVVFTFQRLMNEIDHSCMLSSVAHIEVVDKRTITLFLHHPNQLLPRILSSAATSILPADLLAQNDDEFWKLPIGTGPFRLKTWSTEQLALAVNEDYFMGRAYLDEVILFLLPSEIPNAYQMKWRQLITNDSSYPDQLDTASWEHIDTPHQSCCLLTWNRNKIGPQKKLAFRQAIHLIIDRHGLTSSLEQTAVPARGMIAGQDSDIPLYRYDPERAKELLIEADYDGGPLLLICNYVDLESAEWLQQQCAQIGITVHIEYIDKMLC